MASFDELHKDDEFSGISFSQLDGESVHEVKPVTYALMSWWKGLGNKDTIDISEGSDHSRLNFTVELKLDDDEIDSSVDAYLDAFEDISILMYCAYPEALSNLSSQQLQQIQPLVSNVNKGTLFGSFEVLYNQDHDGGRVRYKSAICTHDVLVGKVAMVESLINRSTDELNTGINNLIQMLHG